jgi:hypothetical protein
MTLNQIKQLVFNNIQGILQNIVGNPITPELKERVRFHVKQELDNLTRTGQLPIYVDSNNFKVFVNQDNYNLNIDIKYRYNGNYIYPLSVENYKTHTWNTTDITVDDTQSYKECIKCGLESMGNDISNVHTSEQGDFSCAEMILKGIIE